ncbi:TlpA family protein disulfide reductase [Winogradskyella luteola]|uniref:TlpA family protein disulfide reductase n=1 Tax=Winogradskyella luteola TaxID=2828330 RepID=A0A9X1JMN5_9FLAO|nr:TlpA disulfide reductase family protein [Winogradskyella luteola]MBV7268660.1 TlpA family protein disulfide reductase [Winogradskyella luteola]
MKAKLTKRNIIFFIIIAVLIIPQTREPLQILLHKGLSYINQSSLIDKDERVSIAYSNWKLKSDNSRSLTFNNTKGKVVFINFWATWCPPCIAEMPNLQLLYNDYSDKVEFLFVTTDDFETVEKFKNKKNFNFEVFNSLNEIPEELYTRSIPRTFIINKRGEIVVDESGAVDWNSETVRSQLNDLLIE